MGLLAMASAAELGVEWDGEQQGWIRAALRPLRMIAGPFQHFQSAIFEAWQPKVSAQLAEREGFRGAQFLDVRRSQQLLSLPTCGNEIKCC